MFIFHVYDVTVTSGGGGDGGDVITANSQPERAYSGYYQRQLRTIIYHLFIYLSGAKIGLTCTFILTSSVVKRKQKS